MKLFISHASEDRQVAEQIQLAALGDGHEVFLDQNSLPVAADYHTRIREEVHASDGFVFLISPDSVAQGSYALTELKYAREKWPHPDGAVVPVLVRDVEWEQIPNYLRSVTVLKPLGNVAAEVLATLRQLRRGTAAGPLLLGVKAPGLAATPSTSDHNHQSNSAMAGAKTGSFAAWMTLISTLAAVASVGSAIWTYKSDRSLREKVEARTAIAEWARGLNRTGGACAAVLAHFSGQQFKEFANRASNKLVPDQKQFLRRCVVDFDKGTFDADGDLDLNDAERLYLADQVGKQLAQYELLALAWNDLGAEGKATICAQAVLPLNSPYREFKAKAEGTDWWKYPKLAEFMAGCKP